MKRLSASVLVAGLVIAGIVAASPGRPAAASDDEIVNTDKAVTAALIKGDRAVAEKYLDPDFSWIDTEGVMRARDDAFRVGVKPAVPVADDVSYVEHKYGNVVWLQGESGKTVRRALLGEAPGGLEAAAHNRDRCSRP